MSTLICSIALINALFAQSTTTTKDGCRADYAYVYIETSLGGISQTIPSERVNFAPYRYSETIPRRKLALFANNEPINRTHNNPCDVSTWTTAPAHYANSIVAIDYSTDFAAQCSPQQWTLNLQLMGANAVLITDRVDSTNLYPLTGDELLSTPTIPTRMISQVGANQMLHILEFDLEELYVSINCLDTTAPPKICVMDDSIIGSNVELDGEFERQDALSKNGHPVWLKRGMTRVWDNYYLWLSVDQSESLNPWKWVIGKDFEDESSITAECLINSAEYIDDPTLCGKNWFIADSLTNLTSSNGVCDLTDSFVCASSGSKTFDSYFAGVYRQVHDGVPVWFGDNTAFNAFISVQYVNFTWSKVWAFTVTHAATGAIYAFCPISNDEPTREIALEPFKCNANWYTVIQKDGSYQWYDDPLMDVDICSHPSAAVQLEEPDIVYPQSFCLKDINNEYSHYQTYYGVYRLMPNQVYDGRKVYRNERLKDNLDEWYIVYYDEKDSWIINKEIPSLTYTSTYGGICRADVGTPDQCKMCWQFYQGLEDETNCGVRTQTDITSIQNCVPEPVDNVVSYTQVKSLCFDDGELDKYVNVLSGKWEIEPIHYHNYRRYWSLNNEYFMFYDSRWRFWVIHDEISIDEEDFSYICLKWDQFEPWTCDEWYAKDGSIMHMSECTMAPTSSPTPHPTAQCLGSNMYVSAYSKDGIYTQRTMHSSMVNFPPYASTTFYNAPLIEFEEHTLTTGNPCDASSWVYSSTEYEGKVVLIEYSDFYNGLCSPQQWSLQMESYANVKGVLIANNADFNYVYPLNGESLSDPTTPTRMISQLDKAMITHAFARKEEIFIDFGCFDDSIDYPSTICLIDTSIVGKYVYLDGEYHRDARLMANDHPVWIKDGHEGLWETMYMFLDVDQSVKYESSWKWVIGTSIDEVIAVCDVNAPINDPSVCLGHWMINGTLNENITTSNTQCALGDEYVCVDATSGGFFESYFAGTYRQIHEGVSLWLYESEERDVHIQPASVYWPDIYDNVVYGFAFIVNQTESYAFCVIGENYPTREEVLSPELCNNEWYVMEMDEKGNSEWKIDLAFDVDSCQHPNVSTTTVAIDYPEKLCFNDPTNSDSHYQSHYGIYVLDTDTTFDGKYVYKNQRLSGQHDEWFMLWFDEKDAWVLNEMVPGSTVVENTDGICREEVATPDQCTKCWQFFEGYEEETNCNIKVTPIESDVESDCVSMPVNNIQTYTQSINLCFNDGVTSGFINPYSGKWHLHGTYGQRSKWILADENNVIQYYMFYDETWRFWVIDSLLGRSNTNYAYDYSHYYCTNWRSFEPFDGCETWYSSVKGNGGQLLPGFDGTLTMTKDCTSMAPTKGPTPSPTVACDAMNAYVSVGYEQYSFTEETVSSYHTNFAPFAFDTFFKADLVLFEDGRIMTDDSSNPCDFRTWQEFPYFYEDKVVLIEYDVHFDDLCTVEFWTLNLEQYGSAKAVLIGNDFDLHHVYALSGNEKLSDPMIPTRMISQFASQHIGDLVALHNQPKVSFGCFSDVEISYPSLICLVDTSNLGEYVYLDGEYQRQAHHLANDHPVWVKEGHEGLWSHMYMWLDVDQSVDGDGAMRWVIGSSTDNIIARCHVKSSTFDTNYYIQHPALCDGHWYVEDVLRDTIITSDKSCSFGDNYVCVESANGGLFDTYFDGQYRQIHSGVSLWLLEDSTMDAYLTVGRLNMPPLFDDNEYAFAFMMNQTQMFAFCVIGKELPSDEALLKPWECNDDWYKVEMINGKYQWVIDYAFDIDRCVHSQIARDFPSNKKIDYPETLCMNDVSNALSVHQSHYGVYVLDNETSFDGRFVYKNQRLDGEHNEWYMLWYDEQDSWVINEMVPEITAVRNHEGICDEEVNTPDLCSKCWQFYDADGKAETMCDVKVEVASSNDESDCMKLPMNAMSDGDYTQEIMLGFDDGSTKIENNVYTGKWKLGSSEYNDRKYWSNGAYFMFYDATWRYWVIDRTLGSTQSNEWHMFCLNWYDFEPFSCQEWYTQTSGFTLTMDNAYIAPTTSTTKPPTTKQSTSSTQAPSVAIESTDVFIEEEEEPNGNPNGEIKEINEDGAFHVSWMIWTMSALALCWAVGCLICTLRKRRKQKKKRVDFKGVDDNSVYGISDNPDDINVSMVQMDNFRYGAGTIGSATGTGTKGKGEIIAMNDSDASSSEDNDEVVKTAVLDGTEGNMTLNDEDDDGQFLSDDSDHELYGPKKMMPTKKGGHKKKKSWVKF